MGKFDRRKFTLFLSVFVSHRDAVFNQCPLNATVHQVALGEFNITVLTSYYSVPAPDDGLLMHTINNEDVPFQNYSNIQYVHPGTSDVDCVLLHNNKLVEAFNELFDVLNKLGIEREIVEYMKNNAMVYREPFDY